jgi:predicted nucleotidyltransferase
MAKKPSARVEYREVVYDRKRWTLLLSLRKKATRVMEALEKANLESIVHGSIARGDISEGSDVDVFVSSLTSTFSVEAALEKAGIPTGTRLLVQATPTYTMKAHIEIDETTSVTFPLMKLRKVEREFYRFGGEADLHTLREGSRVPGVDKRLMLIEPTERGHVESTIVGREEQVAKSLGVSVETVLDRVHTLLRRDEVGRTGVFVKQELSADETFEMALSRLARKNPAVRRRLRSLLDR